MHNKFLILPLLLLPLASLPAHADESDAWKHLDQAQAYMTAGEPRAALISLKNAAKAAPNNRDIRLELGRAYLKLGSPTEAAKELQKAVDLGIAHRVVAPPLAEALVATGEYQQVIDLLANDKSLPPRVLAFRGDAYLSTGDLKQAREDFMEVLDSNPDSVRALLGLARADIVEDHSSDAFTRIRQAITADPESAKPWSLLGDLELKNQRSAAALTAYQTALRLSADFAPQLRMRIASLQMDRGQLDAARDTVDPLREALPDSPVIQLLDAALSLKEDNPDRTADILNRLTALYPSNAQAKLYLGLALLEQKKYEQAVGVLQSYRKQRPGDANGSLLLGIAHARGGSVDEAHKLLEPLLKENPRNTKALEALRVAATRAGDYDQAAAYESQLASLSQIQEQLGEALEFIKQGDRSAALQLLDQTTELYPEFYQAKLLQYRELVRDQKFADAARVAEQMQDLLPDSAQPKLLLGIALAGQKDYTAALAAMQEGWKISPGAPDIGHRMALLQQLLKDNEQAKQTYDEILQANPGHTRTLLRLATLSARLGDQDAVLEYLKQAVDSAPGQLRPRLLLSTALFRRGETEQSLEVMQEVEQHFDADVTYVERVLQLQIALKDWPAAIISGKQLIDLKPDLAIAHLHLAEAYGHAGDLPALSAEIGTALALDGPSGLSTDRLIRLAALGGSAEIGQDLLERLQKQYPDDSELVSALVAIAVRQQRNDDALALARDMQKRFPDESRWPALVVQILYRGGDQQAAIAHLQRALKRHPDAPDLKMLEASLALQENDNAQAIERYQQVLAEQPNNVAALNNLAWLTRDTDPAKALDYARRAVKQSRHPQVLDTFGVVLLSNDKPNDAVKVLRMAVKKAPASAETAYHLATALAASGNAAEAKTVLEPLLAGDADFDSKKEAQTLYDRL